MQETVLFLEPCLGKGIMHAGERLHGRRKHRQNGQGKDAHLDFMCLEIKIWAGCCPTAPPWWTLGTKRNGKVNSKCLQCLDCMLQSVSQGYFLLIQGTETSSVIETGRSHFWIWCCNALKHQVSQNRLQTEAKKQNRSQSKLKKVASLDVK